MTPAQCRAARGALGWNQMELSVRAGIYFTSVSNFEREARAPGKALVKALRDAFMEAGVVFYKNGVSWK